MQSLGQVPVRLPRNSGRRTGAGQISTQCDSAHTGGLAELSLELEGRVQSRNTALIAVCSNVGPHFYDLCRNVLSRTCLFCEVQKTFPFTRPQEGPWGEDPELTSSPQRGPRPLPPTHLLAGR